MESIKTDYSKLVYKSGDNKYFGFTKYRPLSSLYLKLISGDINVGKLSMKEFKNKTERLKNKKTRKKPYKNK